MPDVVPPKLCSTLLPFLGIAPGATVIVLDAPPGTDMLYRVNSAINEVTDGGGYGGIISTSLSICENEADPSEAASLDKLLETYSLTGLTFFANTGDFGGTCTDSSGAYPNTIAYPADVPHAVAVGGTWLSFDSGNQYKSEQLELFGLRSQHYIHPRARLPEAFLPQRGRPLRSRCVRGRHTRNPDLSSHLDRSLKLPLHRRYQFGDSALGGCLGAVRPSLL
jgi:hypothetical protein